MTDSVARFALVVLDAVSLLRTALTGADLAQLTTALGYELSAVDTAGVNRSNAAPAVASHASSIP